MEKTLAAGGRPGPSRLARRTRRALVVGVALAAAALLAADYALADEDGLARSLFRGAFAAMSAVALIAFVRTPLWFAANAPDAVLDERELAARNAVYVRAYQILAGALAVGVVYFTSLAADLGLWMPPTPEHWWTLGWGALLAALALPVAVLAWTAPDPLPDAE